MTYVALAEAAAIFLLALYLFADTSHRAERRDWSRERAKLIDALTQQRPMVAATPEPEPDELIPYSFSPEQEPDISLVPGE